jgi:hypothetical protein
MNPYTENFFVFLYRVRILSDPYFIQSSNLKRSDIRFEALKSVFVKIDMV